MDQQPTDIHEKAYNRNLLVLVLAIGSFYTVLNGILLAAALPSITRSFHINTATAKRFSTALLLVNGVMIPVSAWLINRSGSRKMYLTAMPVFFIEIVTVALASNFDTLLTGGIIQELGTGAIMSLLRTTVLSIFPASKRDAVIGTVRVAIGPAPAIGPTLSGWIVNNLSWRYLFSIIALTAEVVIILASFPIKDVLPIKEEKIDAWSAITLTVGSGSLLYGFSETGNKGWTDPEIPGLIGVGIVFVILFGIHQLKMVDPFLDITVFKYFELSLTAALNGITNLTMVGIEMVLSLYTRNLRGMSTFRSGLILLLGTLVARIMSPITGHLFNKYGARKMAITGVTLLMLGTIPFVFLATESSYTMIVVLCAVRMIGITLVMIDVTTSEMDSLPSNKIAHGAVVNNTFRQALSSIGIAILVSVLTTATNNNMPDKDLLHTLPLQYKNQTINAALNEFRASFAMSIPFTLATLVLTFLLEKGNRARENQEEVDG